MIGWYFEKASNATRGKNSPDGLLGKRRSRDLLVSLADYVDTSGTVTGYDLARAILASPGSDLVTHSAVTENRHDRYRRLCGRAVEAIYASHLA